MNNKSLKYVATILFLLVVVATGCSGKRDKSIPDTPPDIQGTITTLKRTASKNEPSVAVVLVDAIAGIEAKYTQASIKIDGKTHIADTIGNELKVEQLQEQHQIEVWFDGPVQESMPVQAHAAAVRLK